MLGIFAVALVGVAAGTQCAGESCAAHNITGDDTGSTLQTGRSHQAPGGFFCKAAWCSTDSVCCKNHAYGLCGSPGTNCCESPGGVLNLCAPGTHCNIENGHCPVGDNPTTPPPVYEKGFFCKAAWCSEGSVCCENGSYGLCGSPGTTCCESPGGVLNLCAPGSYCNHENGHCSA